MKVLVVSHAAVIPLNQEPFDALARAGADVVIVAPRALSTDIRGRVGFEPLAGSAARALTLPVSLGGYRRALGGQRGIHALVYRGLRAAIAREHPEVIFCEEEPFSFAAMQVVRAAGSIPVVVHENQNIERRLPPPFQQIRRLVLARAAGVTVRNRAATDLVRAHGFEGPIGALPHAVDPARFATKQRLIDLPTPVIGFVGRLVPEKGIMDLIMAMERSATGSLLVIGDGPLFDQARARAARIPNRFTGALAHDQVPAWYASMDVVAVPSRTTSTWMEQFGRIVIEANAAGVPVVVSDSGELPNTVAATGGGVVVRESDVAGLADALAALGADPDRRAALGATGRAAVEENFTPAAVAARLLEFLGEVAA